MANRDLEILVVDDMSSLRTIIRVLLRTMGYTKVSEAANGSDAIAILQQKKIDLIISDWNMPRMSGYELLKSVREDRALSGTPFIMITGEACSTKIAMAAQLKVDQFILKPFSFEVLEEKINMVVH